MNSEISKSVNKTNSTEILCDLKSFMGDFYVASFELVEDELYIHFTNGQHFVVCVKER